MGARALIAGNSRGPEAASAARRASLGGRPAPAGLSPCPLHRERSRLASRPLCHTTASTSLAKTRPAEIDPLPGGPIGVFLTKRRATLARLRRVNEALSRWDEHDAAAAMPEDLRPPPVRQPSVSWAALKELQGMLGEVLGEMEEAWERRNYEYRVPPASARSPLRVVLLGRQVHRDGEGIGCSCRWSLTARRKRSGPP
jgi:hypothetical protein